MGNPVTIALGSDHGGFELKTLLLGFLKEKGFAVQDCGTHNKDAVDYPRIAYTVARLVASGECDKGIMIDGAGIGSAMAVNKVKGARAAACYSVALAKRGARQVLGIDFADEMIALANQNAQSAGVDDRCLFARRDFLADPIGDEYDYTIAMGFMDYMSDPRRTVEKVLAVTKTKAFFSFPVEGGILAWQRKLRYKNRCPLYMYSLPQLHQLFSLFLTSA